MCEMNYDNGRCVTEARNDGGMKMTMFMLQSFRDKVNMINCAGNFFLKIYLNIFLINKGKDKMLQAFRDWVTMIHTKYPLADYKIHA